jgi:hypothetical protein
MNAELIIQEGIENDIANLLGKSESEWKADTLIADYFQKKIHEGVVDTYHYTLTDRKALGFWVYIEYTFAWNIAHTRTAYIGPDDTVKNAYDRAMGIII